MSNIQNKQKGFLLLFIPIIVGLLSLILTFVTIYVGRNKASKNLSVETYNQSQIAGATTNTVTYSLQTRDSLASQDGSILDLVSPNTWVGTGSDINNSFLALFLKGQSIPQKSTITSAKLFVTASSTQWIKIGLIVSAEKTLNPEPYSKTNPPSARSVTDQNVTITEDVKWEKDLKYFIEATTPVNNLITQTGNKGVIALIIKGNPAYRWGRKSIYATGNKAPYLVITYTTAADSPPVVSDTTPPQVTITSPLEGATLSGVTSIKANAMDESGIAKVEFYVGSVLNSTDTTTPYSYDFDTAKVPNGPHKLRAKAYDSKGNLAESFVNVTISNLSGGITPPQPPPLTGTIWGAVASDILGTCTQATHDRYVEQGDDGVLYRTWHPQETVVALNNPSGTKCKFAHEHGDDPTTVKNNAIAASLVKFGFIGKKHTTATEPNGHEEAHEGFKVFVANKGQTNDEGRVHLHDSRLVFHMGTGGVKRYDTQAHSMEFRILTNDGRKMFVQAMADSGKVGSICQRDKSLSDSDPTNDIGRSVMVLDETCKRDSLYEIWSNSVRIKNVNGSVVGLAQASTAVFDPITIMDPANHTRLVYMWAEEADKSLNFPNNDRSYVRGCVRESYSGPVNWYNSGGKDVYYSDAMGREMSGGKLRQEISLHGYKNFVATNDGLSQFKLKKSFCASGLGYKN
ncbi:MAG: Ig-like domain-containing protein [Patescibacteria group bacterium]